ncbi:MAG: hypothetical protein ACK4TP_10095 [Hyphomicrobium sp.]
MATNFRPMDELRVEGKHVELQLSDELRVVGWLYCGHPQAPRSFWTRNSNGRLVMVQPIGWRELPTETRVAA